MWYWLRFPVAVVAAMMVVVLAGTAWLLSGRRYQTLLTEHLSQLLDAEVLVADSRVSIAGGLGIELAGITIKQPNDPRPVLTAERFDILLDLKALLQGRLLFNEIRTSRPRIHIVGDPKRELAHLFGLLAAAEKTVTPKQEMLGWFTPTLAVRHVVVVDGGVEYVHTSHAAPFVLSHLDLILSHPEDTGVAVSGSVMLGTKGELGTFTLHALAPTWSTQADQQRVAWNGSVRLHNVVSHQLGRAFGQVWPVGIFSGDLRYDGTSVGPIRVEGTVDAREVSVGLVSLAKIAGTITQLQWNGRSRQNPSLTWRDSFREITAEVQIDQLQGGPKNEPRQLALSRGTLTLRGGTLTIRKLSGLYGKKSLLRTGEITLSAFLSSTGGEFSGLFAADLNLQEDLRSLVATLAKLGVLDLPPYPQQLRGNAEVTMSMYSPRFPTALAVDSEVVLQQFAVRFPYGKVELSDGTGKLHITNRLVEIIGTEAFSCKLGGSTLQIAGQVVDYTSPQRMADLHVSGDVALAEVPEVTKGILRLGGVATNDDEEAIEQILTSPDGHARLQLTLQTSTPSRSLTYEGTVTFHQAEITLAKWNLQLQGIDGTVQLNKQTLATDGVMFTIAGAPARMRGALYAYLTPQRNGEGLISFTGLSDATLAPLLPLKLLVTQGGSVDGKVELILPQGGELHTTGELTLNNFLLDPLPHVFHPFRITQGKLLWQGPKVTLTNIQGTSPGGEFTGSGRLHALSPLNLELALKFPDLDLGAAFNLTKPKIEDGRPKNDTVQVRADLQADRLQYKTFAAEHVRASCYWHGRQADINVSEAKTVGGTLAGAATLWPDHNGLYIVPQVNGADVSRLLTMLNTPSEKITGTLTGKGQIYFPDWHTWSNLAQARAQVSLTVADGVTQQIPVLVRLWSAVSLQALLSFQLPSLPNDGLAFSLLTGDFSLGDGVARTTNLSLASTSVRLETTGEIDLAHHTLDLKTSLMPLHGITSRVAKVPLAGELLARGAEMLTTLPFRVRGPYHDPTVTPFVVDLGWWTPFLYSMEASVGCPRNTRPVIS
jgi:hypothetical protein